MHMAVFMEANLARASFVSADCERSFFQKCIASQAQFVKTKLAFAEFAYARFEKTRFTGADLTFANLHATLESECDFSGANLRNVRRTDAELFAAENFGPAR